MFAPHPHWKTLRNLTTHLLREKGSGTEVVELIIHKEIQLFCEKFIDPHLDEAVSIIQALQMFSCNVISEFVVGGRLDYDNPKLSELVNSVDQCINNEMKASMLQNVPLVNLFTSSAAQKSQLANSTIFQEMQQRLEQHKAEFDPNELNDVFDMFINYQRGANITEEERGSPCFAGTC